MREGFFLGVISGERKGILAALAKVFLWVLSLLYGIAIKIRAALYAAGLKRRKKALRPVISIGNITTGGTGKTPMVAMLSKKLHQRGHKVAVLSRGYRARGAKNEEGELLEKLVPTTAQVQGKNRVAGAARAVSEHGATCLLLDDGFQHWRLERDLDVVTVDAMLPLGYGKLLPAGLLREPVTALSRADAFVVTRADQVKPEQADVLAKFLSERAPGAVVARARHGAAALIRQSDGVKKKPETLKGKKVMAFCGIGNPRAFKATLRQLGAVVKAFVPLADHQLYPAYLLKKLDEAVRASGAEYVVTTEKDAVKITDWDWPKPCFALRVEMEIFENEEEFMRLVLDAAGEPAKEEEKK